MKNDPTTPGTDDLSGSLADSVGQIRDTPLPAHLGQQAMQRAVAYTSPWTPRSVALWSGVAASIVAAAFVSGALIIRWTQPAAAPTIASAGEATVASPGVTNVADGTPVVTPVPTPQVADADAISFRLSQRRLAAVENPQVAVANDALAGTLVVGGNDVRLRAMGELQAMGTQPVPSLPPDAKTLVERYQADQVRYDRAKAELEVERAKIESQRASQRAEMLAQLTTLSAQYKAAGKTAEGDAVAQQIALLNNAAAASFRLTDGTLVRTGDGVLVLNGNGNFNALPAVAGVAATPALGPGADNIAAFRQSVGQTFQFTAVGSTTGTIWGSGIYTDDSPLGVAAVHAGVLKDGERGVIKITVLPGQANYDSTTKNGVTSSTYANWQGSYRIEGKVAPITVAPVTENLNRTLTITTTPPTEGRSGRRIQPNPDGTLPAGDAFQGRSGRSGAAPVSPQEGRLNTFREVPVEVRSVETLVVPAPQAPTPPSLPAAR